MELFLRAVLEATIHPLKTYSVGFLGSKIRALGVPQVQLTLKGEIGVKQYGRHDDDRKRRSSRRMMQTNAYQKDVRKKSLDN